MRRGGTVVAAVVLLILLGALGILAWRQSSEPEEPASALPAAPAVDPSVPEYKLLHDALQIVASRESGTVNFSYLPKSRPPDLSRLHLGGGGDTVGDGYQFGKDKLLAIVEFGSRPVDSCKELSAPEICVREGQLSGAAAGAGKFRYIAVRFTGNVAATPNLDDPATAEARRFWATVEMVPISEAAWFSELVARARNAVRQ